ncbi:MarR family transcriptional regulator [Granulicatella sp. zg-ZJ]|uniref:MarR family winged helix-turn-helix transcriptional regulator n=1 Tax=Granulicatella sp. zg-ZJ TaxID=2678504 RepID=UPI0013D3FB8D|nr:MarR family transcriptional regulator [Granulicatella sp. zg-ZJ]NEW62255.1 MarR family transcriptional regulator [Granulicatella sp. zg-ZJ]
MKEKIDLKKLGQQIDVFCQSVAKKHNIEHLGGPQGHVVFFLKERKDEKTNIKDIQELLHIQKSVASNLIKRMEKNGFIRVEQDETDKRYKYIVLTEIGEEKADYVKQFFDEFHSTLLQGISKENIHIVLETLKQIEYNLECAKDKF